jgi:hypothetical protein
LGVSSVVIITAHRTGYDHQNHEEQCQDKEEKLWQLSKLLNKSGANFYFCINYIFKFLTFENDIMFSWEIVPCDLENEHDSIDNEQENVTVNPVVLT